MKKMILVGIIIGTILTVGCGNTNVDSADDIAEIRVNEISINEIKIEENIIEENIIEEVYTYENNVTYWD